MGPSPKVEKQPVLREGRGRRRQITRNKRRRLPPVREEVRRDERPRKRTKKAMSPGPLTRQRVPLPLPSTIPHSSYVSDRIYDTYRRDPYVDRRSPHRDRRDRSLSPIDPYRVVRDPPIERSERYRDIRDPPLERRYAYVVPRDPYIDNIGSYPRRRESYRDGRSPYLESRDPYVESRDSYRDGREPYVETRDTLRDGRTSYYGESTRPELYSTYPRLPLSDSRDVYRDDRGVGFRDSYRQDELLGRRDTHPINPERRNGYVPRERPLYGESLYSAPVYSSRDGVYRL